MERVALLLVDSGLVAVSSRGTVSQPSPGLALIDGDLLLVGQDAERDARLKPRRVHSRFWQSLNTRTLGRPFPHHLRAADLVHAHLSEFWRSVGSGTGEVILVVPGVWSNEQLSLLLGIAESAAIPVRGLVDVAVAATADRATRRRCLHLDLHLHRAVLTELEHGREVVRGRVWEDDRIGLVGLRDLWARTIAHLFVGETRFDPLHQAVTEQLLYLQLARHIEELTNHEATTITVASGGRQHSIEVGRRDLIDATRGVVEDLSKWVREYADEESTTVLISNPMASIPGLVDELGGAGLDIAALHPAAAGSAALNHAGQILSGETALPLVNHLPGYDAKPPGPVTVAVTPPLGIGPEVVIPTHLVLDGVAQPITEVPIVIGPAPGATTETASNESGAPSEELVRIRRIEDQVVLEAPTGTNVVVNDQTVESATVLAAGDRIVVGEPLREILVVTMVP